MISYLRMFCTFISCVSINLRSCVNMNSEKYDSFVIINLNLIIKLN
jgi:hypothetical protein